MDNSTKKNLIAYLLPSDVERGYRGKPGCMCGCNGRYGETARTKNNDLKEVQRIAPLLPDDVIDRHLDVPDDLQYAYVQLEHRCFCVYLNEEGKARLQKLVDRQLDPATEAKVQATYDTVPAKEPTAGEW